MPVFAAPDSRASSQRGAIRAFRVRGHELGHEGLFDGDYVLVGASSRARNGSVVLAETAAGPVLRRTPLQGDAKIMGFFLGVIRRRGFNDSARRPPRAMSEISPIDGLPGTPPSKTTVLRGQLGMLESTCAGTSNPRLQRALRNEAARVRRQLQNEANQN
jgi:hypothetical protein